MRIAWLNRFIPTAVLLKIFSSGQLKVHSSLQLHFIAYASAKSDAGNSITSIFATSPESRCHSKSAQPVAGQAFFGNSENAVKA
jgi:hypothetical protein